MGCGSSSQTVTTSSTNNDVQKNGNSNLSKKQTNHVKEEKSYTAPKAEVPEQDHDTEKAVVVDQTEKAFAVNAHSQNENDNNAVQQRDDAELNNKNSLKSEDRQSPVDEKNNPDRSEELDNIGNNENSQDVPKGSDLVSEDTKSQITIQSCHDGESLNDTEDRESYSFEDYSMNSEQQAHVRASIGIISDVMAKAEENVNQIDDRDSVTETSSYTESVKTEEKSVAVAPTVDTATSVRTAANISVHYKSESESGEEITTTLNKDDNVYNSSVSLPALPERQRPADFPCCTGYSKGEWPIRNSAKTGLNINSAYGGCATLVLCSNGYGGKGEETTSEIFLLRSGFDCNHYQIHSICKNNSGHFGCENAWETDEVGNFIGNLMFGTNHLMLLSNDSKNGNNSHGVFIDGVSDGGQTSLMVNVNGNGAGNTLTLCSGLQDGKPVSGAYMIRHGFKDNFCKEVLIAGENKWKFSVNGEGVLQVTGPSQSKYCLYNNREERIVTNAEVKRSNALMTQAWNGEEQVTLVEKMPSHGMYLITCSNSRGTENKTAASLYAVTVDADVKITSKQVVGSHGDGYTSSDLWKIEAVEGKIIISGPPGPCRYLVLSSIECGKTESCCQDICLATGEPQPIRGVVEIDRNGCRGILLKPSNIHIKVDQRVVGVFDSNDLIKTENGWAFSRLWKDGEIKLGLNLVRVFMARNHVTTGVEQRVEMSGSPHQVVVQKENVVYALNCCGPAYTSIGHITYASEYSLFSNFSFDFNCGSRSFAYGCEKRIASNIQLLNNTHDGFLHVTRRSIYSEPVKEKKIIYTVKDIPNGEYKLRFHTEERFKTKTEINGKDGSEEIHAAALKAPTHLTPNLTAYYADVPIKVTEGKLVIDTKLHIAGFALLKPNYKDDVKTAEESKMEDLEKQKLMNKLDPLPRSLRTKQFKAVGWSPNLLKNASGETGDLSCWNVSGDIKIHDGGYGTEKAFITSHMPCYKSQEIDLTETFSPEYLDTSPDIEVTEWYREGVCGGGFYEMDVQLLDMEGTVLKSYKMPRTGRIYNNNQWTKAGTMFTNYPKGVRIVSLSSMGKDDKFWGGHFGTIISAAVIRVKRESNPAVNDSFTDIKLTPDEGELTWTAKTERLISDVLTTNKELLEDLLQEEAVPSFDSQFEKQVELKTSTNLMKPKKKRKREIRVFVSSTFKDFNKEREAIIKKAFREINRFCKERGVFFTYVDLRWGISSEQSNEGQTIAICLQEIDRCRPYFIGLLGNRFGWSQKEGKSDEALEKTYDYAIENVPNLKWINDYRINTSVTQLEVLHGVLNNVDANKDRSFFYLRKPVTPEKLTPEEQKVYNAESDWHREKQDALRQAVNNTRELNIREFEEPDEVANYIKEDMLGVIDVDFPKGTELTPLEREREAHEAFADIRCQVYIGRAEYFTTITSYMEDGILPDGGKRSTDDNQPLVLLGESGCGKSALVANWVKRTREKFPDAFMFVHFIGSSAESADYLKMLRRLYEEMKLCFKLDLAIPTSDALLIRDLSKWLRLVGSKHFCIIVLDALNQLDSGMKDDGPEHDLTWIPESLPNNVFMLLSTLPGRAKDAVLSRKWPSMKVSPLEESQKMEIISGYLEGIYGKSLSDEQKKMIVAAPQTNNPLYLRSLLDEVRVYGSFRTLTKRIEDYLQADNPGDLFAKILERMEVDYSVDEEAQEQIHVFMKKLAKKSKLNMTQEATTAIWCSNKGMSEGELIELLNVPSAIWSPFYLSLAESLVNKNGILNFFHDHLRQAVEKKYLSSKEARRQGYLKLADFFAAKELDDRVVDELPFLLARAGELDRLKELITKFEVFKRMADTEEGKFELIKAWQLLGDYSLVEKEYLEKLKKIPEEEKQSSDYVDLLVLLGDFFVDLGLYQGAREVFMTLNTSLEEQHAVSHGTVIYNAFNKSWKYRSKHENVIDALNKLGFISEKLNELDAGEMYYKDAISRANRVITPIEKIQLCEGLLGLASIMNLKDNMIEAKKMLIRSLELATDVLGKQHHFVAAILNKLGELCYSQGRHEEALGYFLQDLKLSRSEVGVSHPRIGRILASIGMVYDYANNDKAADLYEAALAQLLDTYGSTHIDVAKVRYNLGSQYLSTNHYSKAKFQFQEALSIFKAVLGDDHPDVAATQMALDDLP